MDNSRIIYRILSMLEASMDTETFDECSLSPETLGITRARFLSLMRIMIQGGLVEGISVDVDTDGHFLVSKGRPRITLKGLDRLYPDDYEKPKPNPRYSHVI